MKFFRRTLKTGKKFTKNLENSQKIERKNLENLEIGKKYLADTLLQLILEAWKK